MLRASQVSSVIRNLFISAAHLEEALEAAMLRSLSITACLPGRTVLLVDVSGSMVAPLSRRSEMLRADAAYGLAVLMREICEKVAVYTFSQDAVFVPARRGFALRDTLERSQPHGGTMLGAALDKVNAREQYDRLV